MAEIGSRYSKESHIYIPRRIHCLVMFVASSCPPQRVTVTSMTFQQAQDGDLHILVFPSVEASTATYPVYLRENKPQRRMEVCVCWHSSSSIITLHSPHCTGFHLEQAKSNCFRELSRHSGPVCTQITNRKALQLCLHCISWNSDAFAPWILTCTRMSRNMILQWCLHLAQGQVNTCDVPMAPNVPQCRSPDSRWWSHAFVFPFFCFRNCQEFQQDCWAHWDKSFVFYHKAIPASQVWTSSVACATEMT